MLFRHSFLHRYGRIVSTKAVVDKETNEFKGYSNAFPFLTSCFMLEYHQGTCLKTSFSNRTLGFTM